MNLQGGILQGQILLNLDTEEDDEIDIGCAGGIDVTATAEYDEEDTPEGSVSYSITVKGLQGGHSGMDIHKGFGNANVIIGRLLYVALSQQLQLVSIDSGGLRNAIPREGNAVFSLKNPEGISAVEDLKATILEECAELEKDLQITIDREDISEKAISEENSKKIIFMIQWIS